MSGYNSDPPSFANQPVQYALNSKVMVAAIVILFVVVFFILSLHVYAKWFWRHSAALTGRNASWRSRRRLNFTGQEHFHGQDVGLDKAVIDSLPLFVYKQPQTDEAVLECAVCLCEFEENEKGRLLPKCSHSFHTQCIDMWFHSHSTCPLCRTLATPDVTQQDCNAPAEIASPSLLPQQLPRSQSHRPDQIELIEITSGDSLTHPTERREDAESILEQNRSIHYPTRILFWGDHEHLSSRLSSPSLDRVFTATRSLPRMAVDLPSRRAADAFANPRCLSLNLSRCPSTDDQACSSATQPPKSPPRSGWSIKRLLSRGRRVFPSGQEGAEFDQDTTVSPV